MAISRMNMERQLRNMGGLMALEEPRQGYFLGKLVRKAKKAVKKVVKSPLGKIALGAAALKFGGPGIAKLLGRDPTGFLSGRFMGDGGIFSAAKGLFDKGRILSPLVRDADGNFSLGRAALTGLGATAIAAPFLMGDDDEEDVVEESFSGPISSIESIRQQARDYYKDPTNSALYFMPQQQFTRPFAGGGLADIPREGYEDGKTVMKDLSKDVNYKGWLKLYEKNPEAAMMNENAQEYLRFYNSKAKGGLASIPREGYRIGGGVMSMLGKASDAVKNVTRNVMTKLSRMTDDVEIQTMSDYADDTGASLDIFITPKSKKGKDTLDSLVKEGIMTVDESGTYMPKFGLEDDAVMGMEKLKASGLLQEGDKFRRFDEGAGMGEYDMPYYGYDQLIETFGRQKKAEGGLMDLGGMEKDYREGGFVPIGKEERADDVPARLSKNEFVFTADAVRNAGGGDIDKGAEVMQNMMDNLEAGGMISEESQGKENPAQAMFDQAQMLENRIV